MTNPWLELPSRSPYVLPEDRASVEAFNANLPPASPFRIVTERVIPEPFVGRVTAAPVLVLQLNPGYDWTNPASHAQPAFRAALLANLRHKGGEWPFYFFDPRFHAAHPGGRWWVSKTKTLVEGVPWNRLAQRLAVVEWFPYKSQRFKLGCRVRSQEYGFLLVAAAMDRGATIVVARGGALWQESIPKLRRYPHRLTLSSPQNVTLTPNNLKVNGRKTSTAWVRLVRALE